jgi:hypothetical protein
MRQVTRPSGLVASTVAMLVVASSSRADAEAGEWGLSLGPSVLGASETGPDSDTALRLFWGLQGRIRYGLDDFWQLGGSVDIGVSSPHAATGSTVLAEIHYVIDIVTWVPYVSFAVGGRLREAIPTGVVEATETAFDLILAFGAGLEYRPARDYALGVSGRYELLPTDIDRTDFAFQTGLNLTLFFE